MDHLITKSYHSYTLMSCFIFQTKIITNSKVVDFTTHQLRKAKLRDKDKDGT